MNERSEVQISLLPNNFEERMRNKGRVKTRGFEMMSVNISISISILVYSLTLKPGRPGILKGLLRQ